jgi:LmbE family N-acetylglucosaminyl deacetylase
MLLVFAHPDDESFGMGGTIARYANQGVEISLVCSTNGDVGTVSPERLNGYESIADLRLAELHCAANTLGMKEVITYGYCDSGMMGSPENKNPDCLWQADPAVVEGRLVADIRRIRPHVIVTFDPYGGYGHPDHIFMHRATTSAFHKAGDPSCYPEQIAGGLEPYQPKKLYYTIFPRNQLRMMVLMTRLRGQDPRHLGVNRDLDLQAALDNSLPSNTRINISGYLEQWDAASNCHASQANPRQQRGPMALLRRLISRTQEFARVFPEPKPGDPVERDLFAGVA